MNRFKSSQDRLISQFESYRQTYQTNQPCPHLVIDDLFESEVIELILQEFADRDCCIENSQISNNLAARKTRVEELSEFGSTFYFWLNSCDFVRALTLVVNRERNSLLGDPCYHGAGIQELFPGETIESEPNSFLHKKLPFICQFNFIICLNTQQDSECLGIIEICSTKDETVLTVEYFLKFNRTFILPVTNEVKYQCKASDLSIRSFKFLSIYYWSLIPM